MTINASLERLKLKHTGEIRDLRRRLRESNAGVALTGFRATALPNEGLIETDESSDLDSQTDEQEDNRKEASWEEVLRQDEHFSAIATVLESLLRRGRNAVEFVASNEGGRVLSAVEMEEEGGEEDETRRDVATQTEDEEDEEEMRWGGAEGRRTFGR